MSRSFKFSPIHNSGNRHDKKRLMTPECAKEIATVMDWKTLFDGLNLHGIEPFSAHFMKSKKGKVAG